MSNLEKYVVPHVGELKAYVPGLQLSEAGWVKLNTNENAFLPSPKVVGAIRSALGEGDGLRLYPNPTSAPLREAVAKFHDVSESQVIIGNGSDDILNLLFRVFCNSEKRAGMMEPSYSLYPILSGIQGSHIIKVDFNREMQLDIEAIKSCGANLFFLTNPNAPTGVAFSTKEIRRLLEVFEGILVVDETYAPFAEESAIELLKEFPHLVITRSFSKAYGLAGLRVGYGLASAEVIDLLDRVRDSYNVDYLAQAGAQVALEDKQYYEETTAKIIALRDNYQGALEALGWFVYPSQANFLFAEPKDSQGKVGLTVAVELYEFLLDHKILVRHFAKHALTQSFLRISVGSEPEMLRFMEIIEKWQEKQKNE